MPSKWLPVICKLCGNHKRTDNDKCLLKQLPNCLDEKYGTQTNITLGTTTGQYFITTRVMEYEQSPYSKSSGYYKNSKCFKCGIKFKTGIYYIDTDQIYAIYRIYACHSCNISIMFSSSDPSVRKLNGYMLLCGLYTMLRVIGAK
jgi:hypothetical protein